MRKTIWVKHILTIISIFSLLCILIDAIAYSKDESAKKLLKKRDPLVPLVDSNGKIRSYAELFESPQEKIPIQVDLSGILWDANNPRAVINGKVLKEGNQISDGVVLEKINEDNVVVKYKGTNLTVEMRKKEKR